MTDARPNTSLRQWLAVISVSVGTFGLVTSELLPIGVLPKMAADVGVTAGAAGRPVTMPGLIAALAAPSLIIASGRLDRRTLLWLMSGLLIVSNLIMSLGDTLSVQLAARTLLGIGVGGLWAVGAAIAPRLVAPDAVGFATALVFAGISGGTIIGLPAGTYLGNHLGWRPAFVATAGLCALAACAA